MNRRLYTALRCLNMNWWVPVQLGHAAAQRALQRSQAPMMLPLHSLLSSWLCELLVEMGMCGPHRCINCCSSMALNHHVRMMLGKLLNGRQSQAEACCSIQQF